MLGIGYRLLVINLLGNVVALLAMPFRLLFQRRRASWVAITLEASLAARPPRRGRLLFRRQGPSLDSLARLLGDLGKDPRLAGIVVHVEPLRGGWAQLQSIRALITRFRTTGKRVVFHLSGPTLREYYVACAGDSIVVDESGPLVLVGLAAEATFFAGALAKLGARAEAEYRGTYKSFAETFTREDMSPAHKEALDAILDELAAEIAGAVASARRIAPDRAAQLIAGGPYTAAQAKELGIVDGVAYRDEVPAFLGVPEAALLEVDAWRHRRTRPLRWEPILRRRQIRVLSLHGTIVSGEGSPMARRSLGAAAAGRALATVRRDRRVAAVVLHVDSRGGSATGSDLIWREVVRLAAAKPTVAYLHDVAASGGYYLACGATRIVALPGTLTGSIGVVAGKLNLEGLYERLGLRTVILLRGEAAAMHSAARGYSADERRRLAAEVDALYEQFVGKVAAGRALPKETAEAAAKGRVWIGAHAKERRLVDALGDVEEAIRLAESLARRSPRERFDVREAYVAPRNRGLLARLLVTAEADLPEPVATLVELAPLAEERALLLAPYGCEVRG